MPIPIITLGATEGLSSIPYLFPIIKATVGLSVVALLKRYFGGAVNRSTRLMHSKVVMITGGTSGIGAAVVRDLASRGAQIILLTQHAPSDPFLVDYIEDLRESTRNELIYAEQVDLSSLHSIRLFATKWVDNAPPRRLDMLILCANTMATTSSSRATVDYLNEEWQVNYLANFHLLSILSPALRAQPPDRDVRIIFSTCAGYIGGKLDFDRLEEGTTAQESGSGKPSQNKKASSQSPTTTTSSQPMTMSSTARLALMVFAHSFQQHLSSYSRPDKHPTNTRVLLVDPGFSRTPGTRRWLTRGSLWGLLVYLLTWPIWWLVLKSSEQGAQSYLLAAMEAGFSAIGGIDSVSAAMGGGEVEGSIATGGVVGPKVGVAGRKLIKECRERAILRDEVWDEETGKKLWEFSQGQIERAEKESAVRRAAQKKQEEQEKQKTPDEKENSGQGSRRGGRKKKKKSGA